MPSSTIGALRVVLGLDSAQFSTGAKAAENRAEQMGLKIGRSMRGAAGGVSDLARTINGLTTVVGAGTVLVLASQALDYASSLGEVSQQLGVTTKDLQEYRYAASQVGISSEEMDKALAKLTVTMGQARDGVAKPVSAFKELSDILGKDVLKNAATAGDAIPLIADALSKVEDPARRAALEVSLFGKTGQKLDTLLAGGSGAVNELRDAAQSLGVVLSEDQIANADKTADKITELKLVLEANIAGAVANNASAIYSLIDSLTSLISKVPYAINALAKFRDYVAIGQGKIRGALASVTFNGNERAGANAQVAAATADLRTRQNFGKPFFGDKINAGVAAYGTRVGRTSTGAGAGVVGDGGAKKAASDAAKRARDAERAAEKAARDEAQYQQDLSRAESERIGAILDLTVNQTQRLEIERELNDRERQGRLTQIANDNDLSAAQKAKLTALAEDTYGLRQNLITRESEERQAADALELVQARNDNEQDILSAQLGLARTSKERSRLELQILELQFAQLRATQDAVLASKTSTDAEKAMATARLQTLSTLEGAGRTKAARDAQGPLAQYLDNIPKGADEVNEALERIQAEGVSSLIDGLSDLKGGFEGLADTVSSVADQIVQSLVKIALQKGFEALVKALDNSQSGSGDSIAGARAGGGSVIGGKSYLVGERGPEIFRAPGSGNIIANDDIGGGRGSVSFDLRGAVMTTDLLAQMNVIAADTSGAVVGQNNRTGVRRGRQRLA
ncbi:MAG TPA: hypothetical protein VF637_15740 [Sphingomicrobium sp.]